MSEKDFSFKKGRFLDLAERSYRDGIYTFTDFLGLMEQEVFFASQKEFSHVKSTLFGGTKDCERVMVRFGEEESLGYEVDFPISCVFVKHRMAKFSEKLSHRDFLGALMNLGIERDLLGDIIVKEEGAYIFCKDSIAEFITENLTKIRHTYVVAKIYEGNTVELSNDSTELIIQVASERLDAIIAKTYKLSREASLELFKSGKVFLNGRQMTSNASRPKDGDIISVRGYGRIKYIGGVKTTKKGNLMVKIEKFG